LWISSAENIDFFALMMREHAINETEVDLRRSPSLGDGRKG
jgi:hypothetical protein